MTGDPAHRSPRVVATIGIAAFVALLWFAGEDVSLGWVRFVSAAGLVVAMVLAIHDRWTWAWLPRANDLRGTWKGSLATDWRDPETGQPPGPIECFLVVRQTASKISITLLTDQSASASSVADLSVANGSTTLLSVYRNQPRIGFQDRSRAHMGAAALELGEGGQSLTGHYWTDRFSRGSLTARRLSSDAASTYADALALPGNEARGAPPNGRCSCVPVGSVTKDAS